MELGISCARVSTTNQKENNLSLPEQHKANKNYAARNNIKIIAEIDDAISGTVPIRERAGGKELYLWLEGKKHNGQEIKHVVFYRVDRVTRDEDLVEISVIRRDVRLAGKSLHYAEDGGKSDPSAWGGVIDTMKAAGAAEERKKIVARTISGKIARLKAGQAIMHGPAPLGYIVRDGAWEHTDQIHIPKTIWNMAIRGKSLGQIVLSLFSEGIPPPRFERPTKNRTPSPYWTRTAIRQLLGNTAYKGIITTRFKDPSSQGFIVVETKAPAIVSKEQWETVNRLKSDRSGRGRPGLNTLIKGRIRCAACGRMMGAVPEAKNRGGQRLLRYKCVAVGCELLGFYIYEQETSKALWDWITELVSAPSNESIKSAWEAENSQREAKDTKQDRLKQIEKEIKAIADSIGRVSSNTMILELDRRAQQLEEEREIVKASPDHKAKIKWTSIQNFLESAKEGAKQADLATKREVARVMGAVVYASPTGVKMTLNINGVSIEKHAMVKMKGKTSA